MKTTQSIIQNGQYHNRATDETVKVETFQLGYVTFKLDWVVMGVSAMFSPPKKLSYDEFIEAYDCLEV